MATSTTFPPRCRSQALQPNEAVHRRGGSFGLAQPLRRHRHRRVGAVQGLRGRASRQGTDTGFHLLGRKPPNGRTTSTASTARWPRSATTRSSPSGLARALEAHVRTTPYRVATQARVLAAQSRAPVGPVRAGRNQVRVLGAERRRREKGIEQRFDRKNTLVIAAGRVQRRRMALRALEEDGNGLIDGPVVTEPNIGPEDGRFVIRFRNDPPFDPAGRSLYDSITLMSCTAPARRSRRARTARRPSRCGVLAAIAARR